MFYTILATLILGNAHLSSCANGQSPQVRRTDLQRHNISIPGLEAFQVRVDFDAGAFALRHKHYGEEFIHVLEGALEYELDGQEPVTVEAGGVLFVPAGVPHSARNRRGSLSNELATYIVQNDKPLVELVN
jgi:quercetin dioxygenase-like cupin family protein